MALRCPRSRKVPRTAGRPALAGQCFPPASYVFSVGMLSRPPSKFVFSVFKVIATPITAVLDLAIMTNPYLRNLLDLFRDDPIEADEKNKQK